MLHKENRTIPRYIGNLMKSAYIGLSVNDGRSLKINARIMPRPKIVTTFAIAETGARTRRFLMRQRRIKGTSRQVL